MGEIIAAGIIPAGLEMMDSLEIKAAEAFAHAGYPTDAGAILLCELDGSAGTYSLLQPALSQQLLKNKLSALGSGAPDLIATASVGCHMHLQCDSAIPVRHWLELLADQANSLEE